MAKEEKGIIDGFIDGVCRDAELKCIIDATRDENGKVDKWAATGTAMGLGLTSDEDIIMLTAMLGAEGAFDPDKNNDPGDLDKFDYEPIPTANFSVRQNSDQYMSEAEYEKKKQNIIDNARTSVIIIAVSAIGILIFLLSGKTAGSNAASAMCLIFLAVSVFGICYFSNQKERDLRNLESDYAVSRIKRERKEEEKKKKSKKS